MEFIDNEHKKFFLKKWVEAEEHGKKDVYYKSLIYILSICETTREHFKEIFDIDKGEVNIDSIQKGWQTTTSLNVTRMALNLWNPSIVYDCEADIKDERMSSYYAPSEIFCCSYAPYFWEGIKIRYPEYTNYEKNNKIPRVKNIEQLDYHIEEKIKNKLQNKVVGLYIRVGYDNDAEMRYSIDQQRKTLDDYCKKNHIENRIEYIDIGKSALEKDRKALQKMIEDIRTEKINKVVVTEISRLFRTNTELVEFLSEEYIKDINIVSLNDLEKDIKRFMNTRETEEIENDEEF